jgi:phage I-like protein
MNPILIQSELLVDLHGELPSEIMYFPAGPSTLNPSVNGQAKQISVNVSKDTAAVLQAELETLNKENVRPFIDFDHHGGAAAAIPKRFTWKEGQGVMLELDWTGAGKNAVGGRDYSYFSPTFLLDDKGAVAGIPKTGSIGALVNNPAFRRFKPIHAAHAPVGAFATIEGYFGPTGEMIYWEKDLETSAMSANEGEPMTDEEIKALKLEMEAVRAENKKLAEASETKKNDTKVQFLEAKIKELEEQQEAQKIEAASAAADYVIEAAIVAGKIAPKNDIIRAGLKKWFLNDPESAKAHIESMPPNPAFKTVIQAKVGDKNLGAPARVNDTTKMGSSSGQACDIAVREHMDAHPGKTYEASWRDVSRIKPELFTAAN